MVNKLVNLKYWLLGLFHKIMFYIAISLASTEQELLKADPNDLNEKDKKIQRFLHRNFLLEKFYAGKRDEKYVKEYYEILKKADKFIKESDAHKMAVSADKNRTSFGQKDKYGRRYEHYGFFDSKHKHAGKTLGEVLEEEYRERRTKDDEYEILYIFNNEPTEVGLSDIFDVVKDADKDKERYEVLDTLQKSKKFKFPISVVRDVDVLNKIEQITQYMHVKKIGFEHRQLEFFIPLKFKTPNSVPNDSKIFNQLTNIQEVYIRDDYGEIIGFGNLKFKKRTIHNDTHEVFKFNAIEMETHK